MSRHLSFIRICDNLYTSPSHFPPLLSHFTVPLTRSDTYHIKTIYSSSCPSPLPLPTSASLTSGIARIFTTRLVQPVKCWVRWPLPVSGLYCSHANPVSFQLSYTVSTRFLRSSVYILAACFAWGPGTVAMFCFCMLVTLVHNLKEVEGKGKCKRT